MLHSGSCTMVAFKTPFHAEAVGGAEPLCPVWPVHKAFGTVSFGRCVLWASEKRGRWLKNDCPLTLQSNWQKECVNLTLGSVYMFLIEREYRTVCVPKSASLKSCTNRSFQIRSCFLISTCLPSKREKGSLTGSLLFQSTVRWFMIAKPENLWKPLNMKRVNNLLSQEKERKDWVAVLGSACLRLWNTTLKAVTSMHCTGPCRQKGLFYPDYSPTLQGEGGSFVIIKGMLTDLKRDYILLYSSELKICFGDHS